MARTYYEILGVPADASTQAINDAYQAKLQVLQDTPNTDRNQLMVLREIYQVLSNTLKRQMYDQSLVQRAQARSAPAVVAVEADPNQHLVTIKWLLLVLIVLLIGGGWYYHKKQKEAASKAAVVGAVAQGPGAPNAAPAEEAEEAEPAMAATKDGPARNAEQIFSELSGSVARINVSDDQGRRVSIGSGVVIGPGMVITNCHVVQNGRNFQVKVGQESHSAQLDVEDRESDLCRLQVSALRAPAVRMATGQTPNAGQKVFAIGAPHGLDLTISDGIVSGLREVAGGKLIQTTAPVSPGSSGGGLFDAWGNLVGIVTFQHRVGQNLNFAVPVDWVKDMRNRGSGKGSVGSLTMKDGREGNDTEAAESRASTNGPEQKLLGKWDCRTALRNQRFYLEFLQGSRLIGTKDSRAFSGYYHLSRTQRLTLSSADSLDGQLEELSDQRFVLSLGKGERLVCERRG